MRFSFKKYTTWLAGLWAGVESPEACERAELVCLRKRDAEFKGGRAWKAYDLAAEGFRKHSRKVTLEAFMEQEEQDG